MKETFSSHSRTPILLGGSVFGSLPSRQWHSFEVHALISFSSCDVVDVDGNPIPKDRVVPTYAHAQKMRAAMTYAFGRIQRLGSVPWQEGNVAGSTIGNPSVSEIVSSYMVSLRRRKVFLLKTADQHFYHIWPRCRLAKLLSAPALLHRYANPLLVYLVE